MNIIHNSRGDKVGEVIGKTYFTTRDANKRQVFTERHWFSGVKLEHPVGIDKRILGTLLAEGTETAIILIQNYFDKTRTYSIDLKQVADKGIRVDFNKEIKGVDSGWIEQIIFDLAWFRQMQEVLK